MDPSLAMVPFCGWKSAVLVLKSIFLAAISVIPLFAESGTGRLFLESNHAEPNRRALALRIFQARFLRELFRFKWLRQWRELATDKPEE
jgi:hypothetical protein